MKIEEEVVNTYFKKPLASEELETREANSGYHKLEQALLPVYLLQLSP
jgi:hypothetical protein